MLSDFATRPAFETIRPRKQMAPFVFNSAHSGADYPERFLRMTRLDTLSIRQSEDSLVDEIFEQAPFLGAPMLRARFPRAYLDVNREPYELDPLMFSDPLPNTYNTSSQRVASGLGTIARIVAEKKAIYREKLTLGDAEMRIKGIYKPYHKALQELLSETLTKFGIAVLIDCHSMPPLPQKRNTPPAEIVLGDRFGTTCAPALIDLAESLFTQAGYVVARNQPYSGGYITRSYGQPQHNIHALQIEISRHLYLNEATRNPNQNFIKLQQVTSNFIRNLLNIDLNLLHTHKIAAE